MLWQILDKPQDMGYNRKRSSRGALLFSFGVRGETGKATKDEEEYKGGLS